MATKVTDNFVRANSPTLGANWSNLSNTQVSPPASGASAQLLNDAFAPNSGAQVGFPTAINTWVGGGTFGADQFCQIQISAIAPEQSVVAITAASQSAGNTTYTYTLTSGAALQNPQGIIVNGMTNSGNNGAFVISGLGSGTFTVVNASGVTESGSTGIGISATDSLCGPVCRSTVGVLNGYFIYIGNNSGYVAINNGTNDTRVYVREMWKFVNGTVGEIQQLLTSPTIPDTVGDVYTLFTVGNKVALYKNQAILNAALDSDLTSGTPGVMVSSAQGAGQTTPIGVTVGVSGMQMTNFVGADFSSVPSGWVRKASETFWAAGGGGTPAPNPPWAQWTGFLGVPGFVNTGEVTFGGTSSLIHVGRTWANDQASSVTITTTSGNTSQDVVVRASQVAETAYLGQFVFTNGLGAGTFHLYKFIAGSAVELVPGGAVGNLNFGDVMRVEAVGTTISLKANSTTILTASDSSIASGVPGMLGGGGAFINFWSGEEVALNMNLPVICIMS